MTNSNFVFTVPSYTLTTNSQQCAGVLTGQSYTIITGSGGASNANNSVHIPATPSTNGQVLSYTGSGWIPFTIISPSVPNEPVKQAVSAGCSCSKCKDFNEYAEANQPDGSFICYACRQR